MHVVLHAIGKALIVVGVVFAVVSILYFDHMLDERAALGDGEGHAHQVFLDGAWTFLGAGAAAVFVGATLKGLGHHHHDQRDAKK